MSQPPSAEERELLRDAVVAFIGTKAVAALDRLLAERDALADNLEQAQSDLKCACLDRDALAAEVERLKGKVELCAECNEALNPFWYGGDHG